MKVSMYTVFDTVANESGPIFEAKNHAVALRKFDAMLRTEGAYDPSEMKLYCLGTRETELMEMVPYKPAELVTPRLGQEEVENGI